MQSDPHNFVCPDYSQPVHLRARRPFLADNCTDAQAAEILTKAWRANNEVDRHLWQQQIESDAVRAVEETREREEGAALAQAEADQDRLDALKEDQKRNRSKYHEIPDCPPPSHPYFVPAPYAKQKIKQGLYVEMSYFTNRGHALAKAYASTIDDESLVPSTDPISGDIKWIPAKSKRDSTTVILDQDLNTEDLSIAIPRFIEAITTANWPAQRISMLKSFWGQLLTHDYRYSSDPVDIQALIIYQAEQRAAWHDAITNEGGGWNLGIISDEIMRNTREKAYHQHRVKNEAAHLAKVSILSPSFLIIPAPLPSSALSLFSD